jgi:hypothetical protein
MTKATTADNLFGDRVERDRLCGLISAAITEDDSVETRASQPVRGGVLLHVTPLAHDPPDAGHPLTLEILRNLPKRRKLALGAPEHEPDEPFKDENDPAEALKQALDFFEKKRRIYDANGTVQHVRDLVVEALNSDSSEVTGEAVPLGLNRIRLDAADSSQWMITLSHFGGTLYSREVKRIAPSWAGKDPHSVFLLRVTQIRDHEGMPVAAEI